MCVCVSLCECFYVFACSAQHKSHNNNNSSSRNRGSGSNTRWRSNILPLPLAKVAPEKRGKDPDRTLSHIDFCHGRINHRPCVPLRRCHRCRCCRGGFPVSFPPRQATKQMQSAWVQLFSLACDASGTYVACVDCMCMRECLYECVAGRLTSIRVQLASNWACPARELMLLMICKYLVSQMTHAHTHKPTHSPMLLHIA